MLWHITSWWHRKKGHRQNVYANGLVALRCSCGKVWPL